MVDYIYIYNLEQAYFYIREGVKPVYIDKNDKTGNIYFQFIREETRTPYDKWLKNSK